MAAAEMLRVEVVYSPAPRCVWRWQGTLPAGSSLADALHASGIHAAHPGLDAAHCSAGIWGKLRAPSQPLVDGDRVELYRPLALDPKEARRLRQRRQREAQAAPRRAR